MEQEFLQALQVP
uniref:Uncharacterized protein n=1 Tax=Rhizophora mucronata TaxID=61149 RepID=A0A2P2M2W8_RHIMU